MSEVLEFFVGRKGNVISKLPSGKIALVNKNATNKPKAGEKWVCKIDFEKPNYVVVTPLTRMVKKKVTKYMKYSCGHTEPWYEMEVEVPENEEPEPIVEYADYMCYSCREKKIEKVKRVIRGVRKDLEEVIRLRVQEMSEIKPILDRIESQKKHLKELDEKYGELAEQKKQYVKEWLKNARHVILISKSKESELEPSSPEFPDDEWWNPAYGWTRRRVGTEALTLEWDGIKVSYDPSANDLEWEIKYKLYGALDKSNKPFIVEMKKLEKELKETRESISNLYRELFEKLVSDPAIMALYKLLAGEDLDRLIHDGTLKPLMPIFEKWMEIAKRDGVAIEDLDDLIAKVRDYYLYEIDMYDGCFGSIENLGDTEKEFSKLILGMVQQMQEDAKEAASTT